MSRTYQLTNPEGCLTHQLQTGGSGGVYYVKLVINNSTFQYKIIKH